MDLRVAGAGFAVTLGGRHWEASRPVGLRRSDAAPEDVSWHGYDEIAVQAGSVVGVLALHLDAARLEIEDRWRSTDGQLELERSVRVVGQAPGLGFATGAALRAPAAEADWTGWLPFAPGAIYGDAEPVGPDFLGSPSARARDARAILVREDRLSAPVFALVGRAGGGIAVRDAQPDAATTAADGSDRAGSPLIDGRIRVASLGAERIDGGLVVGGWLPAREGDVTYDAGGLPLGQHRGWRERFLPVADGVVARLALGFEGIAGDSWTEAVTTVWHGAWERARSGIEAVREVPEESYLAATVAVLASQLRRAPNGRAGIGLESDPVAGRPIPGSDAAVMGFVGANTDAALALLEAGGAEHAEAGAAVLDAFAEIPMDPPAGEGFDLATGEPACYRRLDGAPAVFLRAFAEGLHAALLAADRAPERGASWRRWALRGGEWLLDRQRADGTFPRAWRAGTGEVLEPSGTATVHVVPFLVALAEAGMPGAARAAAAAGEASWRRAESGAGFAGGTLDNPDVVDKEAAVFALEGYLELARLTGEWRWVARAETAARLAETWIQLWTPPMPVDVSDDSLHWKRGRSAVGMQGITTGVTMTDGFLAVNAAAFVRLARETGDAHWAEVARVVFHGAKAMLATVEDPLDLAGPGWQQEHWNLGPNRGVGLNRHWLPWAAVAVIRGHQRLIALGDPLAERIARGGVRPAAR